MATLLSTTVRDPAHIQAVRLAIDKLRREHRDTLPPPSASKPSLASLLHDAPVSVFDIVSTTLDSEIRDLEAELASMQMDPVAGSRYSMAHYQARLTAAQLALFQLREQLAAAQAAAAAAQNEAAACRQELDAQRSAARELAGRATTWAQEVASLRTQVETARVVAEQREVRAQAESARAAAEQRAAEAAREAEAAGAAETAEVADEAAAEAASASPPHSPPPAVSPPLSPARDALTLRRLRSLLQLSASVIETKTSHGGGDCGGGGGGSGGGEGGFDAAAQAEGVRSLQAQLQQLQTSLQGADLATEDAAAAAPPPPPLLPPPPPPPPLVRELSTLQQELASSRAELQACRATEQKERQGAEIS